jgi:hypothetical protein
VIVAGRPFRPRPGRVALYLAIAWGVCPAMATAQVYIGRDIPHTGTVEVSGGGTFSGGYDLGSISADETRNTGAGTGPFVLFTATSRAKPTVGLQARLGVFVAKSAALEAGVQFARPILSSQLSGDAESAPDVTATETLTRLVVDGSLVLHLSGLSFAGGKGVPFVLGGGGYIRELHEKNEVIETGHEYHAGAGLHLWFGQGKHRLGLRTDVGVSVRNGGADLSDTKHTVPTAGVSLAYLF